MQVQNNKSRMANADYPLIQRDGTEEYGRVKPCFAQPLSQMDLRIMEKGQAENEDEEIDNEKKHMD